ncbi:MAG TPA: HmuY family protein [Ferruginibacter sp.]|nr:HmuY family protein [Ferruginibacter sp.]
MHIQKLLLAAITAAAFTACKKDTNPVFPPSNGSEVKFNGIVGSEAGSAAGNSVYLDLSTVGTIAVARASWDLGFYCGTDFRVVLNNTTSAGIKILAKNDLTTVGAADTTGLTLAVNALNPQPSDLAYFDNIQGDISLTAIPAVSATDASNNVIILNRGTGGGIAARPWMKLRVLRNAAGGYTVQYAGITETSFRTIQVSKDPSYHFKFISFENGIVDAQPEKQSWDLVWTYSVFQANFGAGNVPYNFSDLIAVNHLSGVTIKEKVYADAATATAAYNAFNRDSVNNTTLATGRWTIGSSWRSTQPATGARTDRFYVIKDAEGNHYKFKCLAMGVGSDGGTRGKPEFRYSLIK